MMKKSSNFLIYVFIGILIFGTFTIKFLSILQQYLNEDVCIKITPKFWRTRFNQEEESYRTFDLKGVICPTSFIPKEYLSDPDTLRAFHEDLIERLWNIDNTILSQKHKKLKNIVLKMAVEDIPEWRHFALAVSILSWSTTPRILSLDSDLCSFAKLVNMTVLEPNLNSPNFGQVLEDIALSIGHRAKLISSTAIKAAGCGDKKVKVVKRKCYGNGRIHMGLEFWKSTDGIFPANFKNAVEHLINSTDEIDQYFGLMVTASATDGFLQFLANFKDYKILELLNLLVKPTQIDQRCCEQFIEETEDITYWIFLEGIRAAFATTIIN